SERFPHSVEDLGPSGKLEYALPLDVVCGVALVRLDEGEYLHAGDLDIPVELRVRDPVYYGADVFVHHELVRDFLDGLRNVRPLPALVRNEDEVRYLFHDAALYLLYPGLAVYHNVVEVARQHA